MSQQYRLRLAEGTLLVVDQDALTTWLVDDKALVQPLGAKRWRLLKQFLADAREGSIRPNYWDDPPARRPGRERAPKQEKQSVRGVISGWFGGAAGKESAPERARSRSPLDDMAPLVRALRKAEIPLDVPSTPLALPPDILTEAQPLAAVESVPFQLPEEEEVSVSEAAMAEPVAPSSAPGEWSPEADEAPFYVPEPAAPPETGREPEAEPEPEPEIEITLNKLLPPLDVAAPPAPMPAILARAPVVPAAPPEPAAAPPVPADLERDHEVTINKRLPSESQVPAPSRAIPAQLERDLEITINKQLPPELRARPVRPAAPAPPAIPPELERDLEITINKQLPPELMARPKPRPEAPPRPVPPPEPPPPTPPPTLPMSPSPVAFIPPELEPETPVAPVLSEDAERLREAASAWLSPGGESPDEPRYEPPPSLPPRAPSMSSSRASTPPLQTLADDTGPSLRLKPLAPAPNEPAPTLYDDEPPVEKVVWGAGPMGRFLSAIASGSEVIGEWLERAKGGWERRKSSPRAPLAGALRERAEATRGLLAAWRELIEGWIQRAKEWRASRRAAPRVSLGLGLDMPPPAREMPPGVPPPPIEEDFESPPRAPRRAVTPAAPKVPPATPPPPLEALPTIRLAELPPEPEVDEDMYDGDEGEGTSAGVWVKRFILAVLVLVALGAGATWRDWWPGLKEHGAALNTTLESELEKKRQSRAFEASMAQFPHLDGETVRLLMPREARDITDIDPLEVFRRAYDAADRGLPALGPEETQELTALRGRQLAALTAREQERLRDYDIARRTRGTLPHEDHDALELVARAASTLEPESRSRLQKLNGKAIAAALAHPGR